jgi:hypothetical protein
MPKEMQALLKKKAGSSGSTIAIPSAANAEWLFHREKATLRELG